eukprot:CFRG7835T1
MQRHLADIEINWILYTYILSTEKAMDETWTDSSNRQPDDLIADIGMKALETVEDVCLGREPSVTLTKITETNQGLDHHGRFRLGPEITRKGLLHGLSLTMTLPERHAIDADEINPLDTQDVERVVPEQARIDSRFMHQPIKQLSLGYSLPPAFKMWITINHLTKVLLTNRITTLRGIYYTLVYYFREQCDLNDTVQDIARMLLCTRLSLRVVASPRGYITGRIQIQTRVLSIPGDISEWELHAVDEPVCVIVCEKETVFSHLIYTGLLDVLPCVLLTGQGFPSIATRALVARLEDELHLPVYGVFDYNPAGCYIHLTYRHGPRGSLESYHYGLLLLGIVIIHAARNHTQITCL